MSDLMKIKYDLINEMESNSLFEKVSNIRYKCRCCICGDSQSDYRKKHMYIKCDTSTDEPILYICFKCNKSGIINQYMLQQIGISNVNIDNLSISTYKRIQSIKNVPTNVVIGSPLLHGDQDGYIEYRLGKGFSWDDYNKFKIVWDMETIIPYISMKIKNTLPSNNDSISFLSDDKSTLITRFFNDQYGWKKNKLISSDNRVFYTIATSIDITIDAPIYINIGEGIFDVLSIYKNFNTGINSAYIACMCSDYESAIKYMMCKGFISNNIIINIYIDDNIDMQFLKKRLKTYKWIFNEINIFKNIKENQKDIGVHIDNIQLAHYNI